MHFRRVFILKRIRFISEKEIEAPILAIVLDCKDIEK